MSQGAPISIIWCKYKLVGWLPSVMHFLYLFVFKSRNVQCSDCKLEGRDIKVVLPHQVWANSLACTNSFAPTYSRLLTPTHSHSRQLNCAHANTIVLTPTHLQEVTHTQVNAPMHSHPNSLLPSHSSSHQLTMLSHLTFMPTHQLTHTKSLTQTFSRLR